MFGEACKTFIAFSAAAEAIVGLSREKIAFRVLEREAKANACSRRDREAPKADPRCVLFLAMNRVMIVCGFLD
jgi:hypothetical protein